MSGSSNLDKLLAILNGAVLFIAVGTFVYTVKVFDRPIPEDEKEYKKFLVNSRRAIDFETLKLEKVIVNLLSPNKRLRFLDVQVEIYPYKKRAYERLKQIRPLLYNIIIETAGKLYPDDLNNVAGKILFEDKLKRRINALSPKHPLVKRIYFTKFVIQ